MEKQNDRYRPEDVYQAAVENWGERVQIIVAIEEFSELTKALTKTLRGFDAKDSVAEEMADVEIMLGQLKVMFGDNEEMFRAKLDRLVGRIGL